MDYQQSIFDEIYPDFKLTKPIKLIELFAGYGSQAFALEYLKANFESWRICEWNYKSFHAYKCFHHSEDNTDYSASKTKDELVKIISSLGVSADWNKPMAERQVRTLSESKLREIYNDIQATHNLVDVSRVHAKDLAIEREREREHDYILTYSFPCQDLSLAGTLGGLTASRSGLLWEVERILKELTELKQRPDVLLMENVANVHGEKNLKLFQDWMYALEVMGYKSYIEDLTATDYGIPQTRTRAFMVSILGDYNYKFPHKQPLKISLSDLLEDEVDEKYYLSKKMTDFYIANSKKQEEKGNGFRFDPKPADDKNAIACTITCRSGARMDDNFVIDGMCNKALKKTLDNDLPEDGDFIDTYNKVIKKDGNSGTITTRISDGNHHYIAVNKPEKQLNKKLCNFLIENKLVEENDVIKHAYSTSRMNDYDKRLVEGKNMMCTLTTRPDMLGVVVNEDSVYTASEKALFTPDGNIKRYLHSDKIDEFKEGQMATTIYPNGYNHGPRTHDHSIALNTDDKPSVKKNLRIRKLTPLECFRLMGVKDQDFERVKNEFNDSVLFHLAGDSIVVNVLMAIIRNLM